MKTFKVPITGESYISGNGNVSRTNTKSYVPLPCLDGKQVFVSREKNTNYSGANGSGVIKNKNFFLLEEIPSIEGETKVIRESFGKSYEISEHQEIRPEAVLINANFDQFFVNEDQKLVFTSKREILPNVFSIEEAFKGVFLHTFEIYSFEKRVNQKIGYDLTKWLQSRQLEIWGEYVYPKWLSAKAIVKIFKEGGPKREYFSFSNTGGYKPEGFGWLHEVDPRILMNLKSDKEIKMYASFKESISKRMNSNEAYEYLRVFNQKIQNFGLKPVLDQIRTGTRIESVWAKPVKTQEFEHKIQLKSEPVIVAA